MVEKKSVAVLMATYNGGWIDAQIKSILAQKDVEVTVYVSDDASDDNTNNYLINLSKYEKRLHLLPKGERLGSAGKNFYRLIKEVDFESFGYVAFADQDDIWHPDKLVRHIAIAESQGADGVSSDVVAFWSSGKQKLIRKSQPQRKYDFLFESAGPGCTFLMTRWIIEKVKEQLADTNCKARDVTLHDWLLYAICRIHDRKWVIDPTPTVLYRQHQNNVLGANIGFKAAISRLRKFSKGWYRAEVAKVVEVCMQVSSNNDIRDIGDLVKDRTLLGRLRFLVYAPQTRRRLLERIVLSLLILFF